MKKLTILLGFAGLLSFGAASAQSTTPDAATTDFVKDAAKGGMMEVSSGKLAASKGNSADVRSFGQRMVKDHSAANEKLMRLAKSKNISLPPAPANDPMLTGESGSSFDKDYVKMMLKDHEEDVAKFEKASQSLSDPDVKAFAAATLPVLKEHLAKIKAIAAKMGINQ